MGKVQNKHFLNKIRHHNGYIRCTINSDILEEVENKILKEQHDLLSPSSSIERSWYKLRQKARNLARLYGVSTSKFNELDIWLKYFVTRHCSFSKHFKCEIGSKNASKLIKTAATSFEQEPISTVNGAREHSLVTDPVKESSTSIQPRRPVELRHWLNGNHDSAGTSDEANSTSSSSRANDIITSTQHQTRLIKPPPPLSSLFRTPPSNKLNCSGDDTNNDSRIHSDVSSTDDVRKEDCVLSKPEPPSTRLSQEPTSTLSKTKNDVSSSSRSSLPLHKKFHQLQQELSAPPPLATLFKTTWSNSTSADGVCSFSKPKCSVSQETTPLRSSASGERNRRRSSNSLHSSSSKLLTSSTETATVEAEPSNSNLPTQSSSENNNTPPIYDDCSGDDADSDLDFLESLNIPSDIVADVDLEPSLLDSSDIIDSILGAASSIPPSEECVSLTNYDSVPSSVPVETTAVPNEEGVGSNSSRLLMASSAAPTSSSFTAYKTAKKFACKTRTSTKSATATPVKCPFKHHVHYEGKKRAGVMMEECMSAETCRLANEIYSKDRLIPVKLLQKSRHSNRHQSQLITGLQRNMYQRRHPQGSESVTEETDKMNELFEAVSAG